MKRYIYADEWYPVYSLEVERIFASDVAVECDEELVQREARITRAFMRLQEELANLCEEAKR